MFCPNCGTKMNDDVRFCGVCGHRMQVPTTAAQQGALTPNPGPTNAGTSSVSHRQTQLRIAAIVTSVVAVLVVGLSVARALGLFGGLGAATSEGTATHASYQPSEVSYEGRTVQALARPSLAAGIPAYQEPAAPSVRDYTVSTDLSNVSCNQEQLELTSSGSSALRQTLAQNGFAVTVGSAGFEFFELYEKNRYDYLPNFVTTDSMMHTYHLYFQHLMKSTEKGYLSGELATVGKTLCAESERQLQTLSGSEWEAAARRNVEFFAVGSALLDPTAPLPQAVEGDARVELSRINAASGSEKSTITGDNEDYSQYKPRGYYEGDPTLEAYFRAMIWYGRMGFTQRDEDLDRSALLMTLALHASALDSWSHVYAVTSFFAGAADDCGYYEYYPLATAVYGDDVSADALAGKDTEWQRYHDLTAQMRAPQVNSVADADGQSEDKGFRFLGQRFTLDARIFSQLIYDRVGTSPSGERRMLPNALDVPAAMGSDTALALLRDAGATNYDGYTERMDALRNETKDVDGELSSGSLYGRWLYTLDPLLDAKGEGYPDFMRSAEWGKKDLQTYLGSYTELKHDTVLYAKQAIAEAGGQDFDKRDDRGYVEPEPALYYRLSKLTQATKDGLLGYGMLGDDDAGMLDILVSLSSQLQAISEKELSEQALTDDEYELIRGFGVQLEHFWQEVNEADSGRTNLKTYEYPAALVTDVATGDDKVLELGTGKVSTIYVVVPVDGQLRVCTGPVYSFYQFTQPAANRMTDSEWRGLMGVGLGGAKSASAPDVEAWTSGFQLTGDYW